MKNKMSDDIRMAKMFLIAVCTAIAMFSGCTANERYQERIFKEAALAKGMDATQISCSWSSSSREICVVLAAQSK